jgi:putative oxidoreductase
MNALTPYAALFLRLAVGGVFLNHGLQKLHTGVAGVATFLHGSGIPFASMVAVYLIAVETVGAVCVLLGILTRPVAALMAVNMVVAIVTVVLPHGGAPELEGLLFAGSLALVALGDGPVSVGIRLKKSNV